MKHPYISPEIVKLSQEFQAEQLNEKEKEIPPEIYCFLNTLDFSDLVESLKKSWQLYFNPIVTNQLYFLLKLAKSRDEWMRLGWQEQFDEESEMSWPPKEAEVALEYLMQLVEAHAYSMIPWKRIEWKSLQKKTGPKGIKENPLPKYPNDKYIEAWRLFENYQNLIKLIRQKKFNFKKFPKKPPESFLREKSRLVMELLTESEIEWSGFRKTILDGPIKIPTKKDEARDPDPLKNVLKMDMPTTKEVWENLDFQGEIFNMCSGKMGRSSKDGKPTYLAYSILGKLLGVPPEKIMDVIDNYKHPRSPRPKKRPRSSS